MIDFERGPVMSTAPMATDHPQVARLVACDKFVVDRWEIALPREVGGDDRFHILAVIEGSVGVEDHPAGRPLRLGETLLLPAAAGPLRLDPQPPRAVVLDIFLP